MGIIRVQFMFLLASSSLSGADYKKQCIYFLGCGSSFSIMVLGERMSMSVARVRDFPFAFTEPGGRAWWHRNLDTADVL